MRFSLIAALLALSLASQGAAIDSGSEAVPLFQGRWYVTPEGRGTITQGSSFLIGTEGASGVTAELRVGGYVTDPPTLAVSVDGDAPRLLVAATGTVMLASGLSEANHILTVTVSGVHEHDQNWQHGPALSVGSVHAIGGTLTTPEPTKRRILFIGDSITAGIVARGVVGGSRPSNSAAEASYATLAARMLGAEPVIDAYGGTGVSVAGSGGVPGALQRVGVDDANHPDTGPAPDLIVINLGVNDKGRKIGGLPLIGGYGALLSRLAYAYPRARVVILQPFNGNYREELSTLAQHTSTPYVDLHGEGFEATDGLHLDLVGHQSAALALAERLHELFPNLF